MAGNKYLERDAATGRVTERLSADSSAGAGDAGRIVALNAAGEIDPSMLPPGVSNAEIIEVGVAVATNSLVEVYNDLGTPKIRPASGNPANLQPAVGWVDAAYIATDLALVFFDGQVGGTGFTPGQRVYLASSTPADGIVTTTPVTGAGAAHQFVGRAVSTTLFNFEPDDPIILAS